MRSCVLDNLIACFVFEFTFSKNSAKLFKLFCPNSLEHINCFSYKLKRVECLMKTQISLVHKSNCMKHLTVSEVFKQKLS